MKSYNEILKQELKNRKINNTAYSLRAFARDLQIAPSRLSEIINNKQGLSASKAESIAQNLNYSKNKIKWFISLVEFKQAKDEPSRAAAYKNILLQESLIQRRRIKTEMGILSSWKAIAIRRLTQVNDFQSSPEWIAKRLNITIDEARTTLNHLVKAGHFKLKNNGRYEVNENIILTPQSELAIKDIKKMYKDILNLAYEARFNLPSENRDNAIHVFAINKKLIPQITDYIRNLEDQIDSLTYQDPKNSLYCFTTHLFPLSTFDQDNNSK